MDGVRGRAEVVRLGRGRVMAGSGFGAGVARRVREALAAIPDPELPVITIGELGILRDVQMRGGRVRVVITPTYSGCPAMEAIREDIERTVRAEGLEAEVETSYSPAWTTDWLTGEAKAKLRACGIAPPAARADHPSPPPVRCPRCSAAGARTVSRFGSTACQALLACRECGEPFPYFKTH